MTGSEIALHFSCIYQHAYFSECKSNFPFHFGNFAILSGHSEKNVFSLLKLEMSDQLMCNLPDLIILLYLSCFWINHGPLRDRSWSRQPTFSFLIIITIANARLSLIFRSIMASGMSHKFASETVNYFSGLFISFLGIDH